MGVMAGRTMTVEEAKLILDMNEEGEEMDPHLIMKRFDTLIEKNQIEKGGSFYI